jgi:hypothetical protein
LVIFDSQTQKKGANNRPYKSQIVGAFDQNFIVPATTADAELLVKSAARNGAILKVC